MPSDTTSPEQIEDIMSMLSDMGINVSEAEEADSEDEAKEEAEDETDNELVEVTQKAVTEVKKSEPGERTDDPVRMYLREMGTVELLSREGEIAIAKRIEAGREAMIAGPVRKPADLPGHHHLARRTQRRKDLPSRHHRSRSDLRRPRRQEQHEPGDDRSRPSGRRPASKWRRAAVGAGDAVRHVPHPRQRRRRPRRSVAAVPPRAQPTAAPEGESTSESSAEGDMDDDEFENQMSLAAIEAELKPKVVETFDKIADNYKKLRRLQEQDIANQMQSEPQGPSLSPHRRSANTRS